MKKYMKQISLLLILLSVFLISGCGEDDTSTTSNLISNSTRDEVAVKAYNNTLNLLRSRTYSVEELYDAHIGLVIFDNTNDPNDKATVERIQSKCPNAKEIYLYASSMINYYKGDIGLAGTYMQQIPDNYDGVLSENIKIDREKVISEYKVYQKKASEKQEREETQKKQERDSHIYIDDPEEKIIQVYGQPNEVNKTVTKYGVSKQYVYDNVLIYTEDGYVTGWQDW